MGAEGEPRCTALDKDCADPRVSGTVWLTQRLVNAEDACAAWPVLIRSVATRRAWLLGIANPRPMLPPWTPIAGSPPSVSIAAVTPITWACPFTSGPPELPGLIGASVWIAS